MCGKRLKLIKQIDYRGLLILLGGNTGQKGTTGEKPVTEEMSSNEATTTTGCVHMDLSGATAKVSTGSTFK